VSHRSSSPHQVDGDKSVDRIKDEVRRSGTAVEAKLAGGSTSSSANAPPPRPRERRENGESGVASHLFGGGRL